MGRPIRKGTEQKQVVSGYFGATANTGCAIANLIVVLPRGYMRQGLRRSLLHLPGKLCGEPEDAHGRCLWPPVPQRVLRDVVASSPCVSELPTGSDDTCRGMIRTALLLESVVFVTI